MYVTHPIYFPRHCDSATNKYSRVLAAITNKLRIPSSYEGRIEKVYSVVFILIVLFLLIIVLCTTVQCFRVREQRKEIEK